jgi:hypothetical protein
MAAPLKTATRTLSFFIMTQSLAISLLKKGNNGEQILRILESIAQDEQAGTVTDLQGNPIIW